MYPSEAMLLANLARQRRYRHAAPTRKHQWHREGRLQVDVPLNRAGHLVYLGEDDTSRELCLGVFGHVGLDDVNPDGASAAIGRSRDVAVGCLDEHDEWSCLE